MLSVVRESRGWVCVPQQQSVKHHQIFWVRRKRASSPTAVTGLRWYWPWETWQVSSIHGVMPVFWKVVGNRLENFSREKFSPFIQSGLSILEVRNLVKNKYQVLPYFLFFYLIWKKNILRRLENSKWFGFHVFNFFYLLARLKFNVSNNWLFKKQWVLCW